MLSDIVLSAVVGAVSVPLLVRPVYKLWRDRKHVWVVCHTEAEADRVVKRVWAYTDLEPASKVHWPHIGTPYYTVRVPAIMLSATRFDDAIRKLKEPLNV